MTHAVINQDPFALSHIVWAIKMQQYILWLSQSLTSKIMRAFHYTVATVASNIHSGVK